MTVSSRLLHHIGELTTNDSTWGDESLMGRRRDAALVLDGDVVAWRGANANAPACDEAFDCRGGAVHPGFVDSHTHLVFGGDRADEFTARLAGEQYGGGGIMATVAATRATSDDELRRVSAHRLAALQRGGVTTVEVKSGYDLTVAGEQRLLSLAREFTNEVTFLGAHALAPEYVHERDAYVDLVAGEMMTACAPLATWVDVFCDRGAFTVGEARDILVAGRACGLGVRLHGNQRDDGGGVALAVELDAASVDHCTFVNDSDVALLAASSTVATLLPGAEFCTGMPYPSGRRLVDAGVTVALATDCNPGTSYVTSMSFVVALAVREMHLTPDEALWSATRGGALALRRDDVGQLTIGARADVVVLEAPRAVHLAYQPGSSLVAAVFRSDSAPLVS